MTAPAYGYPSKMPLKFRTSGGTQEYFVPLQLPPGVWHNGTRYQATGRWFDSSLVRWYQGLIMPVGGWRTVLDLSGNPIVLGQHARAAHAWVDNSGNAVAAFGSNAKLWTLKSNVLSDVTPAGMVAGQADGGYTAGAYGVGNYGAGFYGQGPGGATLIPADTWAFDNFGEILVGVQTGDGRIFQVISPFTAAGTVVTNAPTSNRALVVTPEKFLVALGAGGDPRLVQWADQASLTSWTPAVGSQAGSFPLQARGRLVAGRRLRAQTVLWTEADVHAMIYIGSGANAYGFQQIGDNCGLLAPNAVAVINDIAYWMSHDHFCVFDGVVRPLDCSVRDKVFGDFNDVQRSKVIAVPNSQFGEVTWHYPSDSSTENDSYVTYNFQEQTWYYGKLNRNAGVPHGVFMSPLLVDQSGNLYEHEIGTDMPGAPSLPFLESGPYDVSQGDQVVAVQRLLADELALGDVTLTMFGSINPTDAEFSAGPFTPGAPTTFRMPYARQVRLRFDQARATSWRVGVMRFGVMAGGYR